MLDFLPRGLCEWSFKEFSEGNFVTELLSKLNGYFGQIKTSKLMNQPCYSDIDSAESKQNCFFFFFIYGINNYKH